MHRPEKAIMALFSLAFVASLLVLLLWKGNAGDDQPEIHRISILLDGTDEGDWKNFRRGAEEAAVAYHVDLRYVFRYEEPTSQAQLAALETELERGADAAVVVPIQAKDLIAYLAGSSISQPVVVSGLEIYHEAVSGSVGVDNGTMGALLAEAMAKDGIQDCHVFLRSGYGSLDEQRLLGLQEALRQAGISCRVTVLEKETEPTLEDVHTAAVALEATTLGKLAESLPEKYALYGMGVSSTVLDKLETGRIRTLVAVSEYDLGYLSLAAAADLLAGDDRPKEILSPFAVTGQTMFDVPYAQYLMPIV